MPGGWSGSEVEGSDRARAPGLTLRAARRARRSPRAGRRTTGADPRAPRRAITRARASPGKRCERRARCARPRRSGRASGPARPALGAAADGTGSAFAAATASSTCARGRGPRPEIVRRGHPSAGAAGGGVRCTVVQPRREQVAARGVLLQRCSARSRWASSRCRPHAVGVDRGMLGREHLASARASPSGSRRCRTSMRSPVVGVVVDERRASRPPAFAAASFASRSSSVDMDAATRGPPRRAARRAWPSTAVGSDSSAADRLLFAGERARPAERSGDAGGRGRGRRGRRHGSASGPPAQPSHPARRAAAWARSSSAMVRSVRAADSAFRAVRAAAAAGRRHRPRRARGPAPRDSGPRLWTPSRLGHAHRAGGEADGGDGGGSRRAAITDAMRSRPGGPQVHRHATILARPGCGWVGVAAPVRADSRTAAGGSRLPAPPGRRGKSLVVAGRRARRHRARRGRPRSRRRGRGRGAAGGRRCCVSCSTSPTRPPTGGATLSLDAVAEASRRLSEVLDADDIVPGAYVLEVHLAGRRPSAHRAPALSPQPPAQGRGAAARRVGP